uniref:Myocardin related transcription factor A n=1 Tax=Hucho hucho TaxID=62062 RepID=A0A4W5PS24_9TELE
HYWLLPLLLLSVLKLQQRRTREELVSQGIMPPLKSPAAFHEQRRSLERARTEDYLKRKIRSRPERSELVRMHILEETSAEPSLQAKQLQLKRARLADDLNDKISHRPGPMELIHKNILPVHSSIKQAIIETDFPKVAGEISSFDEDSSDTLSPDQPIGQESPLGPGPLPSPPDALARNSTPTQFLTQVPPPPPLPPFYGPCQPVKLSNGTAVLRTAPALIKSQPKPTSERPPQRSKKPKDNKPKVRKLKYHQYIPPDQKADHEPPPQLDSTYAKILHQQQLFLQLQIINQQQQHYNYHTILPAPPKPLTDQPPPTNGPSPSPAVPAPSTSSSSQSAPSRQNVTHVGGATPGSLPANLDDLKVAELKHELKLRSLPVSGTKNDLIERLRNYQAQQNSRGGGSATTTTQLSQHQALSSVVHQSGDAGVVTLATFPFMTTAPQQIMHFGSTSSSPPVSPAPSDRSLAGMSPDETSCNGDSFGEMVSSPLTQLSLHPSPQHHGTIKEELSGSAPTACQFSMAALQKRLQVAPPSVNKDQMLQEKDKQIEELTCMLRQKQRLVETLRSQLEQGKRGGRDAPPEPLGLVRVKEEPPDIPSIPSTFCPIARSPTPSHRSVAVKTTQRLVTTIAADSDSKINVIPVKIVSVSPCVSLSLTNAFGLFQVSPMFLNQQSRSTTSFPFDLLKTHSTPTLVTDRNGNHFLIALTNHCAESQGRDTPQGTPQEISATFKPAPDPSLARLRPNTPSPSHSQAPSPLQLQLHFSPPTPPEPETPQPGPGEEEALQAPATVDQDVSNTGSGRLEDFLESTTGKPLLGVEPGGPLTLIDDLHSQMLSTPSILDHTSSPMDTYELSGYTANPPGLDFGDHALDSMDWLDITMGGASNEIAELAPLGPLGPHTPPSVFSADFLDSSDLQLHWDSCL